MALLDTGFTDWLAIDNQDAESLRWLVRNRTREMQTAQGKTEFDVLEGRVLLDGKEYVIPVLGGSNLTEVILGIRWLRAKRLVVDYQSGVLTLG